MPLRESLRRYELLLPLVFNDGRAVPEKLLAATRHELRVRFGAISTETQAIRGEEDDSAGVNDQMVRVFIDVPDTDENHKFFGKLKERLKRRFKQEEIWITTHLVERL